MRSYKVSNGQKLENFDIQRRLDFARTIHHQITSTRAIDPNNILFTDECAVGLGDGINLQNDRLWQVRYENDRYETLKERRYQGAKVHVRVGIHSRAGRIGPCFIQDIDDENDARTTLTASCYVRMLETEVIPELRRRLTPEEFDSYWFQQDGAKVHHAIVSMDFLNRTFDGRVLSLNRISAVASLQPRPLSSRLYVLGSHESFVNREDPQDAQQLKLVISHACSLIDTETCKKAISDFSIRIMALIDAGGRHFEQTIKRFKLR